MALTMEVVLVSPAPVPRSDLNHTVATCLAKHWQAHIYCLGCRRKVVWRSVELSRLPRRLTINALARAAECTDCGHVGADITLTQDVMARREADMARLEARERARPRWTDRKGPG